MNNYVPRVIFKCDCCGREVLYTPQVGFKKSSTLEIEKAIRGGATITDLRKLFPTRTKGQILGAWHRHWERVRLQQSKGHFRDAKRNQR